MDAAQVFAAPEMMELKLHQIAFADLLILNKADLVGRDEIARIRAWLDEHFHRYRLVEATRGEGPLEILLSAGRFDPTQVEYKPSPHRDCKSPHCDHSRHGRAEIFKAWSYETISRSCSRPCAKPRANSPRAPTAAKASSSPSSFACPWASAITSIKARSRRATTDFSFSNLSRLKRSVKLRRLSELLAPWIQIWLQNFLLVISGL